MLPFSSKNDLKTFFLEEHPFLEDGGLVWCELEEHPFFQSIDSAKCPFFYSFLS